MHFCLFIITKNCPTEEELNRLLAPYNEETADDENSKWDWWQIGGRFSGRLSKDYDPEKDPDNFENKRLTWPTKWANKHNQKQIKDISHLHELTTFAILQNGSWEDQGWKCDNSEKANWRQIVAAKLTNLEPDDWITVIDYHS